MQARQQIMPVKRFLICLFPGWVGPLELTNTDKGLRVYVVCFFVGVSDFNANNKRKHQKQQIKKITFEIKSQTRNGNSRQKK